MKKSPKIIHPVDYRLILAGLLFFINPNISVLDILPDFVGAILILLGFLHLAQIDERAKSAQKALLILTLTNLARTLSILLLTESEGTVWPLIFTFTFGIAEAALFAYGMLKLYAGVIYQAMRQDCPPVYTGFTALNGLTILVAVLKNLLCFLPELTSLSSDYGEVEGIAGNAAQIAGLIYTSLQILNLVVVLAYGIGFWIYLSKFFKTVGKQTEFLEKTEEVYMREVGSKPEVLTYRSLKNAGLLFFFGLLFLIPLRLDGLDYLPDFVAGGMLLAAIYTLKGISQKNRGQALLFTWLYTAFSLAEWIQQVIFNNSVEINYDVGYYDSMSTILLRYPEKLGVYYLLVGTGIVKYVLVALLLIFVCRMFVPVIAEHTGSAYETQGETGAAKGQKIRKGLLSWCKVLTVLSVIAALSGIFYRLFRMFSGSMLIEYTEIAAVALLFAAFLIFLNRLQEAIDNKYYFANQ